MHLSSNPVRSCSPAGISRRERVQAERAKDQWPGPAHADPAASIPKGSRRAPGWRVSLQARSVVCVALLLSVFGCGGPDPSWNSTEIEGLMPDLELRLTDVQGRVRTAADFRGTTSLLFFGFTHCPDICPTTLSTFGKAIRGLGPDAERVRLLFVSVDPRRDTPEVLADYTAPFGSEILALRGEMPVIETLAQRYGVSFGTGAPDHQGHHSIDHNSAVLAFDRRGRIRLLMREETGVAALTADLERLVRE
jgi:protein SCO1